MSKVILSGDGSRAGSKFSAFSVFARSLSCLLACVIVIGVSCGAPASAATIGEVRDAFGRGDAAGGEEGGGASTGQGAGVSVRAAAKDENDRELAARLKKLLDEIKKEEPEIDSVPVALNQPPATGENSIVDVARVKRSRIFVAMFNKAHGEFAAGKFQDAFESFASIYGEFGSNSKALYFMTLCRSSLGETRDAIELAEELLEIVRERAKNRELLAGIEEALEAAGGTGPVELTAQRREKLNEKAGEIIDRIKSLFPGIEKIPAAGAKKENDQASGRLDELRREIREARLEALNGALKLFEKGDYDKAFEAFEKAHEKFPYSMRALYFMALCKKRLGKPDESVRILAKVAAILKNRRDVRESAAEIKDDIGSAANGGSSDDEDDVIAGTEIRVVTYNIAKGQGQANNSAIFVGMKFLDMVSRLLEDEKADLIAMQEVDNNRRTTGGVNQAKYIADRLGMFHFWHEASARGAKENINEHGNAVLSKHKLSKKEYVEFKSHGDPSARPMFSETRGLSCAQAEIGGARIYFISTHFGFPERARVGQARELVEYIKKLDGPVILAGDFNTRYSEKSQSYRIINAALDNALDKAKVKGPGKKGGRGVAPPDGCIDFIFFTPGAFSCESIVKGGSEYDAASDHKPMITVLKLRKKKD